MSDNINDYSTLYNVQIPSFESPADIQKALIAYHYGSEESTLVESNAITDLDPVSGQPQQSIAGYLRHLQLQIDAVSGVADIPASIIDGPQNIVGGKLDNTPGIILGPSDSNDGAVLTFDISYTTGLQTNEIPKLRWKQPAVTLTNIATLTNKTLEGAKITDHFADSNGNRILGFTATTGAAAYVNITNNTTTNAPTISSRNATGSGNIDLVLQGQGTGVVKIGGTAAGNTAVTTEGTQTLTNKTISVLKSGGYDLTIPTISAADSVVTNNTSATLTGKTLSVASTTFLEGSKYFRLMATDSGSATAGTSGSPVLLYMPPVSTTSDTLVGINTAQTLANKTLTSPTINTSIATSATFTLGSASSDITIGSTSSTVRLGTTATPTLYLGSRRLWISSTAPSGATGDIWIRV